MAERMPGGRVPDEHDLIVTYLPLCHVAERVFSTWHLVSCGSVLNFAESIDTITANLREVQPTLFFAVPRIWEKIHAGVLIRANDATWLKRKVLGFGLRARPLDRPGQGRQRRQPHARQPDSATPSASRSCCGR